MMTLLLQRR